MNLMMRGSQWNPQGNGSIHLTQAKAYGRPLQVVVLQFTGDGNTVTSSLDLNTLVGSAKAKLTYHPKYKGYEVQCDAPEIRLADVQPLQQKNAGIAGILAVSASGRGTLDDPQITTTLQIPQLQIQQTRLSGISSTVNVADHKASLTLDSEVAQTRLQARGAVDLTVEHYLRANFDTKGLPIEGLLALYSAAKSNGPHGVVEVHAFAEGPLDDKEQIKAQLVIPTLKAEYQGLQISNTEPVRIHYANAIVAMDPTEFTGTDTDFRLQGQLPLHSDAPTTLAAKISYSLLQPTSLRRSGRSSKVNTKSITAGPPA
jgi:translocation and assembly module TamB